MQTFQWQDADFDFEEENTELQSEYKGMTVEETKESIQLRKYQDPSKDEQRQSQLALIETFGDFFASGNKEDIAKDLLTEDFEIFVFNSTGRTCARNASRPQGFIDMFKDIKIYERRIRTTNIDSEKSTACQICIYKISYGSNSTPIDEIACEIFSIRDGRISKYRASFGNPFLGELIKDPLEPTKKDRMLAKIKQINYALAGLPDFERVKSLLGENAEFKIWRWNDFKPFIVYKNDFVSLFKELQENMSIINIVPYEISTDPEGKYVTATYVYHLEDNSSGQRYDWLSTCIYGFDDSIDITRVSQQGELYPEGEVDVPFEVNSREILAKKIDDFTSPDMRNLNHNFLDSNFFLYDCIVWTVCFACPPGTRCFQGFKQVNTLIEKQEILKNSKMDFTKTVDIFVDYHDKSHDVAFGVSMVKGRDMDGEDNQNESPSTAIILFRLSFENGKIGKMLVFMSKIVDPIDSPFDDKTFQCLNIKLSES